MATHVEYSIPKNNVTVVVSEPGKKNQDPPIADNPVQRQDGSPGNDSTMRSQQAQGISHAKPSLTQRAKDPFEIALQLMINIMKGCLKIDLSDSL